MNADPVLFRGGTLVTMDGDRRTFQGDVHVKEGRIADVGTNLAVPPGTKVVDCRGQYLLPGFVQGHVHLGQTLFRGLAEGKALLPWLRQRIWPLEAALDDETAYWSARLGAYECLLGGTTTIQDMGLVRGTDGLLRGIRDSGLRAIAGKCLMDTGVGVPKALQESPERALDDAEAIYRRWHGSSGGRIHGALCPRFILSCSTRLWEGVCELAQELRAPVHTHLLEHPGEEAEVREVLGTSQMEYFHEVGVLDTDLRIAHGVQFSAEHAEVLADRPLAVVHCPSANLKLGSGIADLVFLSRRADIRLAIGCDSAACNNTLDIQAELRMAALLQGLRHGPGHWSARETLELATIAGARALGLDRDIGSLETGKRADIVVLDLRDPSTFAADVVDVYDRIVYGARRDAVRVVMVDGIVRVEGGKVVDVDPGDLRAACRDAIRTVLGRVLQPWW